MGWHSIKQNKFSCVWLCVQVCVSHMHGCMYKMPSFHSQTGIQNVQWSSFLQSQTGRWQAKGIMTVKVNIHRSYLYFPHCLWGHFFHRFNANSNIRAVLLYTMIQGKNNNDNDKKNTYAIHPFFSFRHWPTKEQFLITAIVPGIGHILNFTFNIQALFLFFCLPVIKSFF